MITFVPGNAACRVNGERPQTDVCWGYVGSKQIDAEDVPGRKCHQLHLIVEIWRQYEFSFVDLSRLMFPISRKKNLT